MKKVVMSVAVVAAFAFASCGGPSVCDCVKLNDERMEAEDKDAWDEENKDEWEACEEMEDERDKEYKDASDEEKKELNEKWDKEEEDCK